MNNLKKQPVFYPGSGVVSRTVYDVRQWDGRTVGTVKVGYGARTTVLLAGTKEHPRWDITSLSYTETGGVSIDK